MISGVGTSKIGIVDESTNASEGNSNCAKLLLLQESTAAHEVSTNKSHPTFPCFRDRRHRRIVFRTGDYVPLDSMGKHYGVGEDLPYHAEFAVASGKPTSG